jgi:hypothetical protein
VGYTSQSLTGSLYSGLGLSPVVLWPRMEWFVCERIWKEAIVVCVKALSGQSSEKN